jgi:hypothetical protein
MYTILMKYSKRLFLLAMGAVFFSFQTSHPCQFLFDRWEMYKAIDIDEVAAFPIDDPKEVDKYLSSEEYKAVLRAADSLATYMMGKQFIFAQDYVIVDSVKYEDPYYELSEEEPITYLYGRHHMVDKSDLGIQEEVNKIQIIQARLYTDKEEKKIKDPRKVKGKPIPIPMPHYPLATFYADNLIVYKDEIIMPFSIVKAGEWVHHRSWQKYLCLRRVKEK